MQIVINTAEELGQLDREILSTLLGVPEAVAPVAAPKAAPAPKAAAAPKAEPVKPVAVEEPVEEPEEDLVGGGPTIADAIKLATELVSNGRAPEVKAALAAHGVKRVSELTEDSIGAFVTAIS